MTLADYERIVAHAAGHAITVVPEVDVPGHVNAALRAYPELWGGERPEPFTTWSAPGHSLDVRSEVVMRWLDDVIRAITPGEHFHLGGDEVEGLAHEDYVQFMWDACSLVLERGKTPDRVGGGRRGEAAQGHGRPALVATPSPHGPRPSSGPRS